VPVLYEVSLKLKGKCEIVDLEAKASKEITTDGTVALVTRWATHGVPNDVNSHIFHWRFSHRAQRNCENYAPLKAELTRGYVFSLRHRY
jgi:glucosamine--fructose-6-phosphate aminotransferase (isomerizing)